MHTAFKGGRVDSVTKLGIVYRGSTPVGEKIKFRVVSADFEGISDSDRTQRIHEVLLDDRLISLLRARILPTGQVENEFDVYHPSGHDIVVIEVKAYSEVVVVHKPSRRRLPTRSAARGAWTKSAVQQRPGTSPVGGLGRLQVPAERGVHDQTSELRHHFLLWIAPAVLLVVALLPWPYGYYTFLRLSICGASVFLAYGQWIHENSVDKWVIVFSAIAVLYNPFVPVYLTREIWSILNVATAVMFILHFASIKRRLRSSNRQ